MALTKIKAGSIADGAVTSAKLAAGVGGVPSSYISTAPTLTSSATNVIVVTNHSAYGNPRYSLKIGSTSLSFTQSAGTLTVSSFAASGSQTVTVTAADVGKLFASANVSCTIENPAAQYWAIRDLGNTGSPFVTPVGWLQFCLGLNGTNRIVPNPDGSQIIKSREFTAANAYAAYINTTNLGQFWEAARPPVTADFVGYNFGSAVEPLSIQYSWFNTTSYYVPSYQIVKSSDGTNWVSVGSRKTGTAGSAIRNENIF
jgi:hypothetical protein